MTTICPLQHARRVYCAGPLFNAAERGEMLEIAEALARAGFEPFVPHADGMEFSKVLPHLTSQGHDAEAAGRWLHEAIFALDTYQVVVGCGSLVLNMNGRVPDEGGVAEMTMAWMLGKPILAYKEDVRSALAGRDNPLLIGQTKFERVEQIEAIGPALAQAIADQPLGEDWSVRCPPHLAQTITAGERLWQPLKRLDAARDLEDLADVVLSLFGPEQQIPSR